MNVTIDVSRAAQLRDIEASFAACNDNFDLGTLQHPNKPGVTAVESYEILPDADIWANQYDLFRFSERPGERAADVSIASLSFLGSLMKPCFRLLIHALIVPFSGL
jgi:RNA polymerase II-associated factor 1